MTPRVFWPALLSGLLLWTAFFPLNLGPVAFVALVPFLTLVRAEPVRPWRRYLAAFLGGLLFFGLSLKWVRVAHPLMELFAWPGLALGCALYWPLALWLLRRLDRLGFPLVLSFPVVWVGLEYIRMNFPTGFPVLSTVGIYFPFGFGWYFLGYALHEMLPLIQAADLGGVYLVSVAVAMLNGAAYEWFVASGWIRRRLGWPPAPDRRGWTQELTRTAIGLGVPLVFVCYGMLRMTHPPFVAGPRIAALQGNLSQRDKNTAPPQPGGATPVHPLFAEYDPLAVRASKEDPRPDLIIWPETCWPEPWFEALPGMPDDPDATRDPSRPPFREQLARWQQTVCQDVRTLARTHALVGIGAQDWTGTEWRRSNSAILVRSDGSLAGRYDKMHLVPFGEYVPLRSALPWLQSLTPYEGSQGDYSCTPGTNRTRFELDVPVKGRFQFGVLICYEDTDPYLARQYHPDRQTGPGVDFLVNVSNDGWFDGTEQHELHLAISRFRAIECRRSLVRAVNMGISGVIDPDGRVIALPGDSWAQSKASRGVVVAVVPIDSRSSVYAATGDWVPVLCWGLIVVGLVMARRRQMG